jgi:hypothetical protein
MLKRFKTKELIFIALVAAFMFLVDLLIVAPINTITGVHGMGFLIDVLLINALVTIAALILKRFFSVTIIYTLFGLLVIPTAIMGPPTPYKVILGLIIGLVADLIVCIFRYKRIGFLLGVAIANAISYPVGYFLALLLGIPGTEELGRVVWFLTIAVLLLGILGDWIGIKLYEKKLGKTKIVRQISN